VKKKVEKGQREKEVHEVVKVTSVHIRNSICYYYCYKLEISNVMVLGPLHRGGESVPCSVGESERERRGGW
jgi:hypothetical protein